MFTLHKYFLHIGLIATLYVALISSSIAAPHSRQSQTRALPTAQLPINSQASDIMIWGNDTSRIHRVPWRAIRNIAQISVNEHHVLALNTDGRMLGWGKNYKGELSIPRQARSNVVAITTGRFHSVALKSDGTTVLWGDKNTRDGGAAPSNVVDIAAGDDYTVFLHADGLISVRGNPALNTPPAQLDAPAVSVAIAAGASSALALLDNGNLYQWGSAITPPTIARTNVVAIYASGDTFGALLQNGDLIIWGPTLNILQSTLPANTTRLSDGGCGCDYLRMTGLASMQSFEVSASGIGIVKRTGYVTWLPVIGATPPAFPDTTARVQSLGVHAAHNAGIALLMPNRQLVVPTATPHISINTHAVDKFHSTGEVVGWGSDSQLTTIPPAANDHVIQVVAGRSHAVALKDDSIVLAWGDDTYGQSSVPADLQISRPITDSLRVIAVAAGTYHSLALRANGAVVAWGANSSGQSTVPAQLPPAIQISAGAKHSLALLANGEVRAWGNNLYGQTTIPEFTGIQKIVAGANHNVAILASGQAYAWGRNHANQIDIDTTTTVADIAANENTTSLLSTNGQVYVYGDTSSQQTNVPDARIQTLGAGSFHLFAIGIDGQPYAWGFNSNGQTDIPVGIDQALMLTGGNNFSLALIPNNTGYTTQIPTVVPTVPANQLYYTDIDASGQTNIGYQHDQLVLWGKIQQSVPPQYIGKMQRFEHMLIPQQFLAITSDGQVVQWGANPISIPADFTTPHAYTDSGRPVDIQCGFYFCAILTYGGNVHLVGTLNIYNACLDAFPNGIGNIAEISVYGTLVTLRAKDNSVAVWGCSLFENTPPQLPAGWDTATDITDSVYFNAILKPDNTVHVYDRFSHLNYTLDTKVGVSIRSIHAFEFLQSITVLYTDGTIERFSLNGDDFVKKTYPYTDIVAVATGLRQYLLLHEDGTVATWNTCNLDDDCIDSFSSIPPSTSHTFPASQITNHPGTLDVWSCLPSNYATCVANTADPSTNASLSQSLEGSIYDAVIAFNGEDAPQFFNYSHVEYTIPITTTSYQKIMIGPKDVTNRHMQAFLTTNHDFYIDNTIGIYPDVYNSIPNRYKTNVADFDINGTHLVIQSMNGTAFSGVFGELPTTKPVKQIAAGPTFVVVLYVDGSVQVWDSDHQNGLDFIPPQATNITAIDAGLYHIVALRQDGHVVSWGAEGTDFGQADVPYDAQQHIIAIAAGNTFSVALNDSGRLVLWGLYPSVFDSINTSMQSAGRLITALFTGGHSLATISRVTGSMPTPLATTTPVLIPSSTPRSIVGDITTNQLAAFDFNTQAPSRLFAGTGSMLNCTNTNCPSMSRDSVDGYALEFISELGTELVSTQSLALVNSSFTVSTWFKRRQLHRNDPILTFGTPNRVNEFFSIGINNNNRAYCSFFGNDLVSNIVYTDTDWHQYACTFNADNSIRRLYRDGMIIAQDQVAIPLSVKGSPIVLGRNNTSADTADGWIDSVAIYARELTTELTTYAAFPADTPLMQFSFDHLTFDSNPLSALTITCLDDTRCPAWRRSAHDGQALQFTGSDVMDVKGTLSTKAGLSLLYWAKAHPYGNNDTVVLSQENKIRFGFTATKEPFCTIGNKTLTATGFTDIYAWHHYACTFDAKTKRIALIIDGNPVLTANAVTYASKATLLLGNLFDGSQGFIGHVDDVMLYGRALRNDEVRQLYEITDPDQPNITPTAPSVSFTPSKTYTLTKSPTATATYLRTKTPFPATATFKAAPYRSPTLTASMTLTRSATSTALPTKTKPPTRTLRLPTASPTRITATATHTSTPQFITRTIIAMRTATYAATYVAQTQTAAAEAITQTAGVPRTQTAQAAQTQTAYPIPATNTRTATAYPAP